MPGIEIGTLEPTAACCSIAAGRPAAHRCACHPGRFEAHARALEGSAPQRGGAHAGASTVSTGWSSPAARARRCARHRARGARPAAARVRAPRAPELGTCAGLIMLDRDHLGLIDVSVRRNAFGRQLLASRPSSTRGRRRCTQSSSGRPGSRPRRRRRGAGRDRRPPGGGAPGQRARRRVPPELTDERRLHRGCSTRRGWRHEGQRADALARILVRYSTRVGRVTSA